MVAPAFFPPPDGSLIDLVTPPARDRQPEAPTPPPPSPMYEIAISSPSTATPEIPAAKREPTRSRSARPGSRMYRVLAPTVRTDRTSGLLA